MKKRVFLGALLVLLMVIPLYAEDPPEPGYNGVIADTTSATGIATAAMYNASGKVAREMWVIVETAAVNFTIDGTTPTIAAGTNVGPTLPANGYLILKGSKAISSFRCINRVASSGAIVKYIVMY
jgi:hypothetical protein